jgi:protein-tyrosine phosphatase
MIDIHTHILPGIDDGVQSEEESIAFARMAVEDGITEMVATPHCKDGSYENDLPFVLQQVAAIRRVLEMHQVPLELIPGAEVHICPDLVDRIRDGRAPTLANNGKTLLLELSLTQPPPVELESLVFQLKLEGILPIFAHPERIQYFRDDRSRYAEVIRLGAWGQITAGSVLGTFGASAKKFSEELVRKGLIHVLASDAHNVRGRPPRLREAANVIAGWIGEEAAERMVTSTPRDLLAGKDPQVPALESAAHKPRNRSFLYRIFGSR